MFVYLSFLLWPFGSCIVAIRNFKLVSSKNLVWLFTIFYGFTFVVSNESMDAARYIERFYAYSKDVFTFDTFSQIAYSSDSQILDLFVPLLSFVTAQLVADHRFFLGALGVIFGFLYSRNLWFILDRISSRISWQVALMLLVFSLLFPIWRGINGPRFAIAANLFFLGVVRYIFENKRSGLLLAGLSPLVHFSCAFAVVILVLHFFLKNSFNFVFFLFFITIFVSEVDLNLVRTTLSFVPEVFNEKVNDYTNEDYKEGVTERISNLNWYARVYGKVLSWTAFAMVILLYVKGKKFVYQNRQIFLLATFSMLFLAFANLASLVPSGSRFQTLAFMFIFAIYIFYISQHPTSRWAQYLNVISVPGLLLYIAVQVRIGFDTIGLLTIVGNPIVMWFTDYDLPLIELLK